MAGFLDRFRQEVISSVWQENTASSQATVLNDKIALGVLLWIVAEADNKFLPEEKNQIINILKEFSQVPDEDVPIILRSIEIAAKERIDLYTFTHEVSEDLSRDVKNEIIRNLFRVACADKELDMKEHEVIRKIADLLRLDHKEFIDAKIQVKNEMGVTE